jgi:adenylate cyclase
MGDTVNTAARMESLTKELGVDVVLSDTAARHLRDGIAVRSLGQAMVKGKAAPLDVFTIADTGDATVLGR